MDSVSGERVYNRSKHEAQLLILYGPYIEQLEYYWKRFGISEEQIIVRADTVLEHIELLLVRLVKEEEILYANLKERITKYQEELEKIAMELNLTAELPDSGLPLLQKEIFLQTQLDEFLQEKKSRLDNYNHLKKMEISLCEQLEVIPKSFDFQTMPSQDDIKKLEEHILLLEEERQHRYEKFAQSKRELITIMEETELTPEKSFELEVVCYDDHEKMILSNENLQKLKELVTKFELRKKEMELEITALKENLHTLWDRLNINKEVREEFLQKFSKCQQSTLSALKHEIEHCEEIKRHNMEMYINSLRSELMELWDLCFVSQEEKYFSGFYEADLTEDVLILHEKEVEKMRNSYEETKEILEKIRNRKFLWELMMKVEKKAADPNRFYNRGGNLLQEERERKRILKDLPKLEEEIMKAIEKYEENNDKIFLVHGINFQEYIAKQWEGHIRKKENAKIERQKQRQHNIEEVKTPMKRTLIVTPVTAPCKLSCAKSRMSTEWTRTPRFKRPPAYCTPKDYTEKNSIKKSPWNYCKTAVQKIIEKQSTNTPEDKDHDSTSYSQFSVELDKEERKNYRSSVLSGGGKKVLGSKISHNGISRKSVNCSLRKSSNYSLCNASKSKAFYKTLKTPTKVMPARAKLGLPFLI